VEPAAAQPPHGAEPLDVVGTQHADVWETILEGRVELELAPRPRRLLVDARELGASALHRLTRDVEPAAPDADRNEEETVARQGGVDTASALDEPGEAVVAGCKPDAGAHGGDVIEMAPGPLQLEQDRPHPSELRRRLKTEALLACVCVREPVRHGDAPQARPTTRPCPAVALRSRFETAVLEQPASTWKMRSPTT
jgi:hypothetical protein